MLSFRDIRDKNAVNQVLWSKTNVFSLPADFLVQTPETLTQWKSKSVSYLPNKQMTDGQTWVGRS